MFQTKSSSSSSSCLRTKMKRDLFGLSVALSLSVWSKIDQKKKKKKFVRSFFAKTAKIFLEQKPIRAAREKNTRLLLYIYS